MKDKELIAAMRDLSAGPSNYLQDVGNAAADRIEALVKDKQWIIEERDRTFALMLARAERLEAVAEKLRGAAKALEKAASEVSRRGAETGPQWLKLTIAILQARAALTTEADNDRQA